MADPLDVLVFYVPIPQTEQVLEALFAAGAGRIGNYDSCAFVASGVGQFRALVGANPTIGEVGELELVAENRVELTFARPLQGKVIEALRRTPTRSPRSTSWRTQPTITELQRSAGNAAGTPDRPPAHVKRLRYDEALTR